MPKSVKKPTIDKTSLPAKITWLPKRTFELEFAIPWKKVKISYDKILREFVKTAEIKGFRKGKAPLKMVEKEIDKGKLYGEIINQLLPISYAQAISQHHLKPAIAPQIKIISAEENQTWKFKATACELPEVKIGDYKKIVTAASGKAKIWTPDQGDPDEKDKKEISPTEKLNLILKSLNDEIQLDLPDLLIESEQSRLLGKLLDQVRKLGITIEQYATSNNKSIEQIRKEYRLTAEQSLKTELILQAIVEDRQVKVEDSEIDKMIDATGDDKLKKELNTPAERAYIGTVLKKRKAIDYLLSL